MFRPDRRWFSIASIGVLVVAAFHTLGHFTPRPTDDAAGVLDAALRGDVYPISVFGWSPSAHDVLQDLSLLMALGLVAWGVNHLVIAAADGPEPRVVRAVARATSILLVPVVLVFLVHPVAPPFFCLLAVEFLFLRSLRPAAATRD